MKTVKTITKTITIVETSTTRWLDRAKEKHGLSDYALAPMLGISRSEMSNYRNGRAYLSDDAALKLAALLEMESPAPIIASAHAERAKTAEARGFWERWAAVAAGVLVAVGVVGTPTPSHANSTASADTSLYIMFNRRKARKGKRGAASSDKPTVVPHMWPAMA